MEWQNFWQEFYVNTITIIVVVAYVWFVFGWAFANDKRKGLINVSGVVKYILGKFR